MGKKEELVINVSLDRDKRFFKKAEALFEEDNDFLEETPMYQWHLNNEDEKWNFEFIDTKGVEWTIKLEPILEDEDHYYLVNIENWEGEKELSDLVDLDDIELVKTIALKKVRKRFPEVEIPNKGKE